MPRDTIRNNEGISKHLALSLEILLLVSGGVGLIVSSPVATVWMLAFWVVLALGYVAIATRRLLKSSHSPEMNQQMLPSDTPGKGTWGERLHADISVIGFASAMGLISAFTVSSGNVEGIYASLASWLAPLGIVLAWLLLQLGFSRLYANSWDHEHDGGGLTFPGTDEPGLIEFAYFAFSVGAALQTPTVTTSRMRLLVTFHTIVSFLYATILIGFIVSTLP